MRYKPLAPVSKETILARKPFIKFVSELVDSEANGDEILMRKLENFAYMLLSGIDGFYIDHEGEVDLIARSTGKPISADLHAAFYLFRSYEHWIKYKQELKKYHSAMKVATGKK
jgi:hypothetical protein